MVKSETFSWLWALLKHPVWPLSKSRSNNELTNRIYSARNGFRIISKRQAQLARQLRSDFSVATNNLFSLLLGVDVVETGSLYYLLAPLLESPPAVSRVITTVFLLLVFPFLSLCHSDPSIIHVPLLTANPPCHLPIAWSPPGRLVYT